MIISAPVNHIIPISVVDGPGCRTSIFLQGCNIACSYCHNPETQRLCIHCGACVPGCPVKALSMQNGKVIWNKEICIDCDACIKICPHFASPKIENLTAEQVMVEVRKNMPFIRGITTSGGECTLYAEFLTQLFTLAKKEGLTCLIDSNGVVDFESNPTLMAVTDGVMLDVKAWDKDIYDALTKGKDNAMVKKNLLYLAERQKLQEIRVVYLPGQVDGTRVINGIAEVLQDKITQTKLKLISYRKYGVRNPSADMHEPSTEGMQQLRQQAETLGFTTIEVI